LCKEIDYYNQVAAQLEVQDIDSNLFRSANEETIKEKQSELLKLI